MKLDNDFLEPYKTREVDWGPVGYVTYKRTYSRDGEEWWETCKRVVEGTYLWQKRHCVGEANRPWSDAKAQHSMQRMYEFIFSMKFLPPGRGLFTMGVPDLLEKTGAAANNCGFVSTANLIEACTWAMDHLMLGVGVGFDTAGANQRIRHPDYIRDGVDFIIPDSRQGWVKALEVLLCSYAVGSAPVYFDYSQIRPAGSPVGFGGTASGPEPLREMLEDVRALLDKAAKYGGKLTSTDIVDIMNLIGRCIVSGNIRRSAEIAFGSPDDRAYLQMKDKHLHPKENAHHRWAANHSVICEPGATDYETLCEAMSGVDELGIFWRSNAQNYGRTSDAPDYKDRQALGCNPCAEQTLEHKELCCLVEVFPSRCESYYEFQEVLKYAYLYAKSVTLIPVHDAATQSVITRNRRIGCSLTGIQQAKQRHTNFLDWCTRGYNYLRSLDDRYSTWFNIPRSIKLTSVKPSGTVSKLPGVTSGVHFPPAEHYYQVIRFASDSPLVDAHKKAGYRCVDLSPAEPNTTAIYFPVSEKWYDRAESEVSMWEQGLQAVELQRYWADNQVSITVKYLPTERRDIPRLLKLVELDLKAISFFPTSEHSFEHAPWQPTTKEDLDKYRAGLRAVDLSSSVHETTDEFCSGDTCLLPVKGE